MVRTAAEENCAMRKAVAREVVHTEDDDLEINTLKLKIAFETEFEKAADDGRLDSNLWVQQHKQTNKLET